jgi:DNA repair protein RadD
MKLRPYQLRTEKALWSAFKAGKRRVLLAEPTGGGKTCQAAHMIREWVKRGARVLFVAHRREIINQAYQTCIDWGVRRDQIGVIMADDDRWNPKAMVQIASKDTISRRKWTWKFQVVVVDEAHHAAADTYLWVLSRCRDAVQLGLTATPYRNDGRGLALSFDELIIGATPSELIASGHLAKPRVFTVSKEQAGVIASALKEVRRVRGDFNVGQLSKAMRRNVLIGSIPEHYAKHAETRPTVVYAVDLEHGRRIFNAFKKAGIRVEMITGDTDVDDRGDIVGNPAEGKLGRLATGETQVVVNCMVLTEGWDCPAAKCIILARPTWSLSLLIQMCGRALRPTGETPIILDHAGNVFRHGILPHHDLQLTLEDGVVRKKSKLAPLKQCPKCDSTCERTDETCENCGHEFGVDRELEEESGELEEVDEAELKRQREVEKRADRERLAALAKAGTVPEKAIAAFFQKKWHEAWVA